jgi:GLPGLI family protein
MKTFFFAIFLSMLATFVSAQQFINKAVVEYEVKTNIKKTMGNSSWAEMLKDNMSQFKTGYFNLTFADNKSIYKFDHWEANIKIPQFLRQGDEENTWYQDHSTGKFNMLKNVYGSTFNVEDSIRKITWKLSNETRVIAGFTCRKATGIIMDSVYVFAYYSDEITLSGGPCSIGGLPGLILGLTIPRMYTSFIATKVLVNNVNTASLKPLNSKKYYTTKTVFAALQERMNEWGGSDDDEDSRQWKEQLYWSSLL